MYHPKVKIYSKLIKQSAANDLCSIFFQFMLQIEMSRLQLTKIVTILPYYLVVNNFDQPLRYMEENEEADLWYDVDPGQVTPSSYWYRHKVCRLPKSITHII